MSLAFSRDLALRGISHDLSNYLTVMDGMLTLLRRTEDSERRERYYEQLKLTFTNARELLKQLDESAQIRLAAPVDLNTVACNAADLFSSISGEGIEVDFRPCAQSLHIRICTQELQSVLLNLMLNCRNAFHGNGGRILVITYLDADKAYVSIEDNGCGMCPEVLKRVFEPMFSMSQNGKGMGLTRARAIVESFSGTISIKSRPGNGTTVYVGFPLVQAEQSAKG